MKLRGKVRSDHMQDIWISGEYDSKARPHTAIIHIESCLLHCGKGLVHFFGLLILTLIEDIQAMCIRQMESIRLNAIAKLY